MVPEIDQWESQMAAMREQQASLKRSGLWVSGPSDLLSIGDVAGRELTHSAVVAWLLSPTGRHGLGSRLLEDILRAGWPDDPIPDIGVVVIEREVVRDSRRADIVVTAGPLTLIVENKIWSAERDRQCDDLYRLWVSEPDARFLLLSPRGDPPRQTRSREAAKAWRSLSYPALADWLERSLPSPPVTAAQDSAAQYLQTLRQIVSTRAAFAVGIGGGYISPEYEYAHD